jgi:hypothetical protein
VRHLRRLKRRQRFDLPVELLDPLLGVGDRPQFRLVQVAALNTLQGARHVRLQTVGFGCVLLDECL